MKRFSLKAFLKILALCFATAGFGLVVGCESTDIHHGGDASTKYDNKPWNSPASWEGGGGLGGFGNRYD